MKQQLVFTLICVSLSLSTMYSQSIINVPGDQPNIQSALDAAVEGTDILVAPGTYFENLVWPMDVDGISLIGTEGKDLTIIDGQGLGRVILMQSNGQLKFSVTTRLQGLTIQNGYLSDDDGAGIYIDLHKPSLTELSFKNNIIEGVNIKGAGAFINGYGGDI